MEKERKNKTYTLRFAIQNKETWEHIKNGKKTVETRAATVKYRDAQNGDIIMCLCGKRKIIKRAKKVTHFKTIKALLNVYDSQCINPGVTTLKGMEDMYYSYPGYREKIKESGIIAIELEELKK